MANLNTRMLKDLLISFLSLPEQDKITSILQAVDRKIEVEEKRKRALETLFRTFLQDLMTARRRLPKEFVRRFEEA